jgi:hypothetical protein
VQSTIFAEAESKKKKKKEATQASFYCNVKVELVPEYGLGGCVFVCDVKQSKVINKRLSHLQERFVVRREDKSIHSSLLCNRT